MLVLLEPVSVEGLSRIIFLLRRTLEMRMKRPPRPLRMMKT
jgi:hypothetical protein